MSLPGLISLGSLPPYLFDAMFLNPRIWLPRSCSLFLLSHPPTDSEVSYFLDGLQTSEIVLINFFILSLYSINTIKKHFLFWKKRPTSTYQAGRKAQRCEGMEYHAHILSEREPRGSGNILPEVEKKITVNCSPITSLVRRRIEISKSTHRATNQSWVGIVTLKYRPHQNKRWIKEFIWR